MSDPAAFVLIAALVATTTAVILLHLRIRSLSALATDYERALAEASAALRTARAAGERDQRDMVALLEGHGGAAPDLSPLPRSPSRAPQRNVRTRAAA
ncbi:hypothetical protein V5F59_09705 [Xanthobacter autotrophicus DSM 431]|uniref:hypothetical protein n=1 Tax=Xanthobacter nonsaccharivorans TaxID=3119912 RepID=UPI003729239B